MGAITFESAPLVAMPSAGEVGQAPSCPSPRWPRHCQMGRDGTGRGRSAGSRGVCRRRAWGRPSLCTAEKQPLREDALLAAAAPGGVAPVPPHPPPAHGTRTAPSPHSEPSEAYSLRAFREVSRIRVKLLIKHEQVPVMVLLQCTCFDFVPS